MRVVWIAAAAVLVSSPSVASNSPKATRLRGNPGKFFGPDNYPPEAIYRREQGRVVALLMIDTYGKVVSCQVAESSNSESLDKTTCDIALRDLTFEPPTDRKGRPLASSYALPVRWVLPSGPRVVAPEMMKVSATMTISIDEAGKVLACNAVSTPPRSGPPDPCLGFPADHQTEFLVERDGRPKGATIVRTISQEITPDP